MTEEERFKRMMEFEALHDTPENKQSFDYWLKRACDFLAGMGFTCFVISFGIWIGK